MTTEEFRQKLVTSALGTVYKQVKDEGYNVVFLAVQGSQNYNLDTYSDDYVSDVDMKCFVLPTFKDLYYGNKVSKTLVTNFGQVEVKDLRLLTDLLGKMNSSYLELLYTPYFCVEPKYENFVTLLKSKRDELVQERLPLLVKSMYGMCLEKQKALCHEYEGLKDKLELFGGYDPKQLHHALRMLVMMDGLLYNSTYEKVLTFNGEAKDNLLSLKVNGVKNKERAVEMMEETVWYAAKLYNTVWDGKQLRDGYLVSSNTLKYMEELVYNMVELGLNN